MFKIKSPTIIFAYSFMLSNVQKFKTQNKWYRAINVSLSTTIFLAFQIGIFFLTRLSSVIHYPLCADKGTRVETASPSITIRSLFLVPCTNTLGQTVFYLLLSKVHLDWIKSGFYMVVLMQEEGKYNKQIQNI